MISLFFRTYEGFGESPELQTLLAKAYIEGFQGEDKSGERVVACAKHYAGDGGTINGTDQGNTQCSEAGMLIISATSAAAAPGRDQAVILPRERRSSRAYGMRSGVRM